jgi:hypothetical protein
MKKIQTDLAIKATEELEERVKAELKIPDPSISKAKAVLQSEIKTDEETVNEDTKGNDRRTGDRDDK